MDSLGSVLQLMKKLFVVLLLLSSVKILWGQGYFDDVVHDVAPASHKTNLPTERVTQLNKTVQEKKFVTREKRDKRKVVILFTNKRSGSTFLGELFNQNPSTFYLFEPLFPYTRTCDELIKERVETLKTLATCNLQGLRRDYTRALKVMKTNDQYANCGRNNICFIDRHVPLMGRYIDLCQKFSSAPVRCTLPVNLTLMSDLCWTSEMSAFKILRICDISTLKHLFDSDFAKNEIDYKVIHLIRDPRAIISSRMQLPLDEANNETLSEVAEILCRRLTNNIKFANTDWSKHFPHVGYYRVKHEDVCRQPVDVARDIYKFIGETMPQEVARWIENSVIKQQSNALPQKSPFATKKRTHEVLNGWRRRLDLKQVLRIQEKCGDVMNRLGYVSVTNSSMLHDETLELWP